MKHTDLIFVAKQASAIDTALDAASWVPGFVGAGAGAAQGFRHLAKGNVLKGLGSLGLGAAQLFGGGTALKLLGKGVGYGSKLLKGTSMGAKAMGTAGQLGSRVAQTVPTFMAGAKRVGNLAHKGLAPETTRLGQTAFGQAVQNNSGKLALGGLGASMAGGMRESQQMANQAYDRGIMQNFQSLAESARNTAPNPLATPGAQLQQIPGMLSPQWS